MESVQINTEKMTNHRITGQGLTEYIIVVALIAIGCVTAVSVFGEAVQAQFANMSNSLMGVAPTAEVTVETPTRKTLADFGDIIE